MTIVEIHEAKLSPKKVLLSIIKEETKQISKMKLNICVFLSAGQLAQEFQPIYGVDFKIDNKKVLCMKCDVVYERRDVLIKHVKNKHYGIPDYKCSICNEGCKTLSSLIAHKLKVHDVDGRVTCSTCNRMFTTKYLLSRHIKNFHMRGEDGQRYKCEVCDFVTINSSALYRHKFLHKTEKDMKCKYCEKSFKRKSNLKMHEKIHTGDRRKVCSVCQQAFVQKASLNYHMTKHHPGVKI